MIEKFFDLMSKLSCVDRYSQSHLSKNESVLEHIGFVCGMAYAIGTAINNHVDNKYVVVDMGVLLSRAVVHDFDETITGDIPRPTKYANETIKEEFYKIEHANMKLIDESLIESGSLLADWEESKSNDIEGSIIRFADLLAVLYKIRQEVDLFGHLSILDHVIGIREKLSKQREIAKENLYDKMLIELFEEAMEIATHFEYKYMSRQGEWK